MSKLPSTHLFIDLSDYGRPIAQWIAKVLKSTIFTPIHVTMTFVVFGILAVVCMHGNWPILAGLCLIIKSILDAADGELARVRQQPSHIGRYLDSISDILLNALILGYVAYSSQSSIVLYVFAFIGMQLQGTLYNYYYVILRNHVGGDKTSRIFEIDPPKALGNENQKTVNRYFRVYSFLYGPFDKVIYFLDKNASTHGNFPKWFMTLLSTFGLGFQLLLISCMWALELNNWVLPFFTTYTVMVFVFIWIRKSLC